jgi:hypothetical protein
MKRVLQAWRKLQCGRSPRRVAYENYREEARRVIVSRTKILAERYGFAVKRIAIRDTRRSWGSCSALGNLNFSYKLLFLPPCIREYVIVHELSHLRVLNHSQAFWDEMVRHMPDYAERRDTLRSFERAKGTNRPALLSWQASHIDCPHCGLIADEGEAV